LALKKSEQKKILAIPSNLLFTRYTSSEIVEIAQKAFTLSAYTYSLKNSSYLTIEILREKSLNLGYFLSKLAHLGVRNMDIAKIFDNAKYFKIDFTEKVDEDDLPRIEKIIEDAFVINERGALPSPHIEEKDIYIDCKHSNDYAALYLNCKDRKGLLAYMIDLFDAMDIEIATAKIHTIKNRTKDIFLIEKNGNFCHNVEIIIEKLTKG